MATRKNTNIQKVKVLQKKLSTIGIMQTEKGLSTGFKCNTATLGKLLRGVVLLGAVSYLSSCSKIMEGYNFNDKKMELVQVNKSSITGVQELMGRPTIKESLPRGKVLIYGSEAYRTFLFVRKKVTERRIEVFIFDNSGILREIQTVTLEDGERTRPRIIYAKMEKPNKLWALPFYAVI